MDDITDFYTWTRQQAEALRRRAGKDADNEIDWENVAEEIEALGRGDSREIGSRLAIVIEHLLNWKFQLEGRNNSWRRSISDGREAIAELIEESPSLHRAPAERLARAYRKGRRDALADTGVYHMPDECPWTIEQMLDDDFLP